MIKNKNSVGESVADEMAAFLSSDEYRAVFVRTAAKKEDKKEDKKPLFGKKPKHNHDKDDKCGKKCPVFMAKKADDLQSAVDTLSKISEVFDEYGFDKTASVALSVLTSLAEEAKEEEKKEEKDENDAKDVVVEVNDCGDEMPKDMASAEDDSKKAEPNSEDVSGEDLRALLSELGLSSGDNDTIHSETSLQLDEDFADDYEDLYVLPKESSFKSEILKVAATKSKPKGDFIFPKDHPKVTDDKDHYPINSESRGRSAIAQANKMKKAPPWYKGTVEQFLDTVVKAVKKKYKGIEISPAGKNPGKG